MPKKIGLDLSKGKQQKNVGGWGCRQGPGQCLIASQEDLLSWWSFALIKAKQAKLAPQLTIKFWRQGKTPRSQKSQTSSYLWILKGICDTNSIPVTSCSLFALKWGAKTGPVSCTFNQYGQSSIWISANMAVLPFSYKMFSWKKKNVLRLYLNI